MRSATRSRRGVTILEVLVALFVLQFALLGLAAAGVVALRATTDAVSRARAATIAANRLESLRLTRCAISVSGEMGHPPGITEWWTVQPLDSSSHRLSDSVEWVARTGRRGLRLEARAPC